MEPAKSIFRKLEDLLSHLRQTFPRKTDVFSRDPTFSKTVILLSHIFMHVFSLSVSHTAQVSDISSARSGPSVDFFLRCHMGMAVRKR